MTVLSRSRAEAVRRTADGVEVVLADGRVITGSHCLVAVGAVPNTAGIGLEEAGVRLTPTGHVLVDRVSRTTAFRVYAAGDCTGVLPLASVAAMQGRIAMWHALGDAVAPLDIKAVAANIFTAPEIATIGVSEREIRSGSVDGAITRLPVARNPRAKMLGIKEGFIKIFSDPGTGVVIGGVVVAPRAGELIFPVTLAVANRLTVDQVADAVEEALRTVAGLEVLRDGDTVVARTHQGLGRRVVVAGHLDTVPIQGNLPTRLVGDELWGRGTVDMKGGVAVALHLAATLAAPTRDVTWVFYDHEEVEAERNGLGRVARTHPEWLAADFAILGEPTGAAIEGGCNGTLRVELRTRGRTAHSARAWRGVNAVHAAAPILQRLSEYRPASVEVDSLVYREGLNAVAIRGGIATAF